MASASTPSADTPELSIVVPVYNEAPNLDLFHRECMAALEQCGRTWEIVAVDDGSRDGSFEMLRSFHEADPRWRIVRLARNFGQNRALFAGFEYSRGRYVLTIDADLQNPPEEIPKIVAKLDEGYDIAQGWRENRQDSVFRLAASRMVNKLTRYLTKTEIRDLGSGLKGFRRETVDMLLKSTHLNRYLPAETAWLGARVGEVKVAHRSRHAGESKYNLLALLRVNFDMIASISTAPVHLIALMGLVFAIAGFCMGCFIGGMRILYGNYDPLATITALLFFLGGVQLLSVSVLAEYISRIYIEVQRRPLYIVGEVVE